MQLHNDGKHTFHKIVHLALQRVRCYHATTTNYASPHSYSLAIRHPIDQTTHHYSQSTLQITYCTTPCSIDYYTSPHTTILQRALHIHHHTHSIHSLYVVTHDYTSSNPIHHYTLPHIHYTAPHPLHYYTFTHTTIRHYTPLCVTTHYYSSLHT